MSAEKPSIDDLRIDRSREPRAGRSLLVLLAVLVIVAACAVVAWRWLGNRPVAVRVAIVSEEPAGASPGAVLNASGYVTARRRATVSSKVTGKVTEVLVEEGMAVKKGQVLARLDTSTADRYLTLARAELAAAKRAVSENEVRLAQARTTLRRTQSLVKDGIMTAADLDTAQTETDALDARLALAREQVAVSERQVAVRENDVADLTITAPFSAIAISKDAQPGEMVSPISAGGGFTRTGICTIVDMASLEIEVDVNESYINRVAPRQRVQAVLDAYPDWKIPAQVITTIPSADRQKATVLVRIAFDRLDPRILPDMGVKVAFLESGPAVPVSQVRSAEVLVPRAAVRRDASGDVVLVVRDGVVDRRPVKVGVARGDMLAVVGGLTVGERVVIEGPAGLNTGTRVSVIER